MFFKRSRHLGVLALGVQPNLLWPFPNSWFAGTALEVSGLRGLINPMALAKDLDVQPFVALLGRNVVDAPIPLFGFVPVGRGLDSSSRRIQRHETVARKCRRILQSAKDRLRIGVVIDHPETAEGGRDA